MTKILHEERDPTREDHGVTESQVQPAEVPRDRQTHLGVLQDAPTLLPQEDGGGSCQQPARLFKQNAELRAPAPGALGWTAIHCSQTFLMSLALH